VTDSITIRELATDDYPKLARFNARFPDDNRSEGDWLARFRYWWDENPAYDEHWKRGFVLLDSSEIVGFVGSFPTFIKAGDVVLKAFNGTTWRVLEQYRKWSIELWAYNREVSANYISFNTTPTNDVIKMILRLKYKKLPWGADRYSYLIGNPRSFAQLLPSKIPYYAKPLVATSLRLVQRMLLVRGIPDYAVKTFGEDLSDLESLWERTKHHIEYTNIRNAASMDWYRRGKTLHGVYQGTRLVAIVLYIKSQVNKDSISTQTMVDFWCDPIEELQNVFKAIIAHDASAFCSMPDLALIKYPHFSADISKALSKAGLYSKDSCGVGYVRIPSGSNHTFNSDNSYFTLLQGDYGA